MVKEMSAIAQGFIKGAGCTVVVNKSADSSMNKGTKNNRNPFLGRVMLKKTYSGFVMGTDYRTSVENTAKRIGNEGAKAELKTVWHKPVTGELGEWFSTDKRTESKFYLKLQRNEKQVACKVETEFFLDGRKATDEEVYLIKYWWAKKTHKQSSTQTSLGMTEEEEQHFLLCELSTVVAIRQGERVWFAPATEQTVSTVEVEELVHSLA